MGSNSIPALLRGSIRSAGRLCLTNQTFITSASRKDGALATFRIPCFMYRLYSKHGLCYGGSSGYSVCRAKDKLSGISYSRWCSVHASSNSMMYNLHLAWRRLFQMHSYRGSAFSPISRMACAVSMACTRAHLVPSIFALLIGEMAWTPKAWADGEYFPIRDTLFNQATNGHIQLTSFIFSLFEGFVLFFRAVYLAILFTPSIVMAPFVDYFGPWTRKTWLRLVRFTLENGGPAFIKWGQWAATRPDLFPRDLCAELAKLHTQAPAHRFAYSKKTIEKAFGRKLFEIFEIFEEEPVASGSIAQVHRASLKFRYPGQQIKPVTVAVKVRHPGVGESIRRDFAIINIVAKVSNLIPALQWLRLDESLQQFAVFMMSQVDLAREAAHLSRFIYNFRRWKNVSFPKPVYPLVHPAVLVESYEQGESVSHFIDELDGNHRLKSAIAHIGTHALLKMLLVDNFIHADMHPGNILVRVSLAKLPQKNMSRPHVVFLDVGMTAELSRNDRINLLEFFKAVALRDGRTAAQCTLRLSKQQKCPNPDAFIEEVERSFSFWGTPEGDVIHPAECMQQLLEQVRRHKVNIDGNVCTVMVTTLVLEGWQRKLDPNYNVMKTLQTVLFKMSWAQSLSSTIDDLTGKQAVLLWGKSPTILHEVCDLHFVFFSDPELTPILAGTLVAACYGSKQNKGVVQQELSMDMLLSLLKSCRQGLTATQSDPSAPKNNAASDDISDVNQPASDTRKLQSDLSARSGRNNLGGSRASLTKGGLMGTNGRLSRVKNQRESKGTKACDEWA